MEPWITPGTAADAGQVFLAELHHPSIDFHHVEVLDAAVSEAFTGGAAVAAADHQHPFDGAGTAEGWMDQRLVVVPFLLLSGHPAAIQQQTVSVALAADHADALIRAGFLHQQLSGQAVTHAPVFFVDPADHVDANDGSNQLTPGPDCCRLNHYIWRWCC